MPSLFDTYEFYLKAEDLKGQSVPVQIASIVEKQDVFNTKTKRNEKKLQVFFVGKKKSMILNKSQGADLMEIFDTDDYSKWHGWITISPGKQSGKDTIKITEAIPADIPPRKPAEKIIDELYPK